MNTYNPTTTAPYTTAKALTQLNYQFHNEWVAYFTALPILNRERFWTLIPNLQKEIQTFRFQYARTNGIEDATDEFFRKAATGESTGTHVPNPYIDEFLSREKSTGPNVPNPYTFEEALHFAATWPTVCYDLDHRYNKLITGYSDDSYTDFMDALPLAGKLAEEVRRSA